MKNVGSTVVSHFVPGALVLRKDCCAVQRCVVRAEVGAAGGKLGPPGWSRLALGGSPGGLGGLTIASGRGSHLGSPTSAYTMQQPLCTALKLCCK